MPTAMPPVSCCGFFAGGGVADGGVCCAPLTPGNSSKAIRALEHALEQRPQAENNESSIACSVSHGPKARLLSGGRVPQARSRRPDRGCGWSSGRSRISEDLEQQQDEHDQQYEADSASAIVTHSRPHAVTAISEAEYQDDENDEQHNSPFATRDASLRREFRQFPSRPERPIRSHCSDARGRMDAARFTHHFVSIAQRRWNAALS